jgi:hypothetical protein
MPWARSFWAFSPTLLPLSGLMTHPFSLISELWHVVLECKKTGIKKSKNILYGNNFVFFRPILANNH